MVYNYSRIICDIYQCECNAFSLFSASEKSKKESWGNPKPQSTIQAPIHWLPNI